MLTKQEFQFKDRTITLERFKGETEEGFVDVSSIKVEIEEGDNILIDLDTPDMRELVNILIDSSFIFSEHNNKE